MASKPIREILRERGLNFSVKHDILIVFGDLALDEEKGDIHFCQPNLWVRGNLTITNCKHMTTLPLESIDGQSIRITNSESITVWPSKLYADTVQITRCGSYEDLHDSEIFADELISDCPGHAQPAGNVFGYRILVDRDNKFYAELRNVFGQCLWAVNTLDSIALHEMGLLKDIRKANDIGSYAKEMGIIPSDAKVFAYEDAVAYWGLTASHDAVRAEFKLSMGA